jgi:hypothetical protein
MAHHVGRMLVGLGDAIVRPEETIFPVVVADVDHDTHDGLWWRQRLGRPVRFFWIGDALVTVRPFLRAGDRSRRQNIEENWRRRPDLNRGWRFCRPLPYHLATAPIGLWGGISGLQAHATARMTHDAIRQTREGWPAQPTLAHSSRASEGWPSVAPVDPRSVGWSGKRDSNPRLRPWQGRTLPLSYSRPPNSKRTTLVVPGSRRSVNPNLQTLRTLQNLPEPCGSRSFTPSHS